MYVLYCLIQNVLWQLFYFLNGIVPKMLIGYRMFNFCLDFFSLGQLIFQPLEESIVGSFIFQRDLHMTLEHIFLDLHCLELKFDFLKFVLFCVQTYIFEIYGKLVFLLVNIGGLDSILNCFLGTLVQFLL